jgi:hypothetical protein
LERQRLRAQAAAQGSVAEAHLVLEEVEALLARARKSATGSITT